MQTTSSTEITPGGEPAKVVQDEGHTETVANEIPDQPVNSPQPLETQATNNSIQSTPDKVSFSDFAKREDILVALAAIELCCPDALSGAKPSDQEWDAYLKTRMKENLFAALSKDFSKWSDIDRFAPLFQNISCGVRVI
jgi:hypothetical protein